MFVPIDAIYVFYIPEKKNRKEIRKRLISKRTSLWMSGQRHSKQRSINFIVVE